MKKFIRLTVNGANYELAIAPWRTLNELLRDELHLTGTKKGCGDGDCGACTVMLDGVSVVSCLTLAMEADGGEVVTVEGLAKSGEELHPIQEAFIANGAIQCGFCTPGMEISALQLLKRNLDPSEDDILDAISGNLCRCTGYVKIIDAIQEAARVLREGGESAGGGA